MAKTTGYGAILKITITATLTLVANLEEIGFPPQESEIYDVTTHDSPSGYAEWIKTGLTRLGAFEVTALWSPSLASHIALQAALAATTSLVMTVTCAGLYEVISFSGLVTKINRTSDKSGAYKAVIGIQPTGIPTITLAP